MRPHRPSATSITSASPPVALRLIAAVLTSLGLVLAAASATPAHASGNCAGGAELVTHGTDGSTGDHRAVVLTAQSMEKDAAGWDHVAWQAADDVVLDAVVATAADGSTRQLPAEPSGVAEDVAAISFCGTVTASEQGAASTAVATDEDDETRIVAEIEPEMVVELDGPDDAASDGDPDAETELDTDTDPDADAGAGADPSHEPADDAADEAPAGAAADTQEPTVATTEPATDTTEPATDTQADDTPALEVEVVQTAQTTSADIEDTTLAMPATVPAAVSAAGDTGTGQSGALSPASWLIIAAAALTVAVAMALRSTRRQLGTAAATSTAQDTPARAGEGQE